MENENILSQAEEKVFKEYREKFELYYSLLREYNEKFNLTSITEKEEVFYKHFVDSVSGEFLFEKNSSVIEVGSGGGFPSLPLKIVREDLSFTLIESTSKKCDFLNIVKDKLEIKNVTVLPIRAEDGGKDFSLREKFDVVTARAVARMNTLLEYCLPFVKVGGKGIFYKGNVKEELEEAKKAISLLGGKEERVVSFSLREYGERNIVVIDKNKNTPQKYPRGNGKERKNPL